jgi:polysaccharide deacetylase family protein (PEP-CTERM system associated)
MPIPATEPPLAHPKDPPRKGHPLLLSVDFEDWHQLVRRRLGVTNWEQPGPACCRQTEALLDLLDELGTRATFFMLGMAARAHPELPGKIAQRGHEIACHGDGHVPVHSQSPDDFRRDLRQARATIEALTGRTPVGYRAPAFSITRDSPWAYDALVQEGFAYDSSQHDSPRIQGRVHGAPSRPHPIELPHGTLWEFPVAVWRTRAGPVPVGGASYWALMPTPLILKGLSEAASLGALYLHPQELDPRPVHVELPSGTTARQHVLGALRSTQRNLARWRAADVLRAIAKRHPLISYGEAHAQLVDRAAARP